MHDSLIDSTAPGTLITVIQSCCERAGPLGYPVPLCGEVRVMPSSIVSPMRCSKEAARAMTFIESHPSGCSGQKRPAKVGCRIPAQPGNVRGVAAGGGEGFSTSRGTVHAGPSWLKMLTKEGVHNVHTLGFGFGCTGVGLGRTDDVFGRMAAFQRLAPGSSPTSGRVPPVHGLFCL
jgi:hypothetical protein